MDPNSLAEDLLAHAAEAAARARRPESTYRLQLHAGFTFRDATAITPYLRDLGITHAYASPYLKARPGSTHGYDICDHSQLNPDLGETVGWPQFIDAINTAWDTVPPASRTHAVIFTENYGEAGAIDVLGGRDRLPHAFSGHNGFSLWARPRPDQTTTIVVGYDSPASVSRYFTGCRVVDRVSNPYKLNNDEYALPVMRCSGLTAPWPLLWPRLRHYN